MSETLTDDGLTTPEVGRWALDKYKLVSMYSETFVNATKRSWQCRVYLDLFAGAGRAKVKGTNQIVLSSAMLAATQPNPFDRYVFCDLDSDCLKALEARVTKQAPTLTTKYLNGDSNKIISSILEEIPRGSKQFRVLTFCFVDPFSLSNFQFESIRQIAERYVDFLVLIPTQMDARRNIDTYLQADNKVLANFFGDETWRDKWREASSKGKSLDVFLVDLFGDQMQALQYIYRGAQDTELIRNYEKNAPLYRLAFFSRSKLGEKLWKEIKKYSSSQLSMGF